MVYFQQFQIQSQGDLIGPEYLYGPGLKHNSISGISHLSRHDAFERTTNPLSLCGAINKGREATQSCSFII